MVITPGASDSVPESGNETRSATASASPRLNALVEDAIRSNSRYRWFARPMSAHEGWSTAAIASSA